MVVILRKVAYTSDEEEYVSWFDYLSTKKKKCKVVYNELISRNTTLLDFYRQKSPKFGFMCTYKECEDNFNNINRIMNITKFRDFQYRSIFYKQQVVLLAKGKFAKL